MGRHYAVRQGDSLASIAAREGMLPETIWEHAENTELREQRTDPNVLYKGDTVFIPNREPHHVEAATEATHRFKQKIPSTVLRIRLIEGVGIRHLDPDYDDWMAVGDTIEERDRTDNEEPATGEETARAGLPYVVRIGAHLFEGETENDGLLECPVPADARRAEIILNAGTAAEERFEVRIGDLNPESTVSGLKQRLMNLGFLPVDDSSDMLDAELNAAIKIFQKQRGLDVTGELDDVTRSALQEIHER